MKFFSTFFTPRKTVSWTDVFTPMNKVDATMGETRQMARVWGFKYFTFNGKVYPSNKEGSLNPDTDAYCRIEDVSA